MGWIRFIFRIFTQSIHLILKISPIVSVCMITYNHEPFIAQAIESVLMQEISFPIELVIGEDESSDGTRAICEDYAGRYPNIIRLHLRSRNDPERKKYAAPFMHNFIETLKSCRGKYIALLEGDDYWTDPLKLQKQVDFLEANPDCHFVFAGTRMLEPGGKSRVSPEESLLPIDLDALIYCNYPQTASVMYRTDGRPEIPDVLKNSPVGDWPLNVHYARKGGVGFIPDLTAAYRKHESGIWAGQARLKNLRVNQEASRVLMEALPREIHKNIPLKYQDYCRKEFVREAMVWGADPWAGLPPLFYLIFCGQWPFDSASQALRALVGLALPRKVRSGLKKRLKRT